VTRNITMNTGRESGHEIIDVVRQLLSWKEWEAFISKSTRAIYFRIFGQPKVRLLTSKTTVLISYIWIYVYIWIIVNMYQLDKLLNLEKMKSRKSLTDSWFQFFYLLWYNVIKQNVFVFFIHN
jgi:hypothetical protein